MYGGVTGRILFVDLTSSQITVEKPPESLYRDYLGGYGLGARILFSRLAPGVDPLGPDNILGFTTGPLVGTPAIAATRFTVVTKSPLTGTWGDSNSGGYFGPALKFAGFDAVFISGRAARPVYLLIRAGRASLHDAAHLWGKDTNETEDLLKEEWGKEAQVASIGPAGEKLALISAIIHDKGRAAGRSGVGAVMGSKNLKAVVVAPPSLSAGTVTLTKSGSKNGDPLSTDKTSSANLFPASGSSSHTSSNDSDANNSAMAPNRSFTPYPLADPGRANDLRQKYLKELNRPDVQHFRKYGTIDHVASSAFSNDSPVKNWAGVGVIDFPQATAISDDALLAYQEKKYACWRCPLACGGIFAVKTGPYKALEVHKPEYETCAMFGNNLLNDNVESLIKLNDLCNRLGLDTISAGGTLGWAFELYEKGLLTKADTDGLELNWGNHAAAVTLTEKMGRREGFGDLLADGSRTAAQRLRRGLEYAIQIQGQELPAHDPKYAPSWGLYYQVDATPGRHTQYGLVLHEVRKGYIGLDLGEPVERYRYQGKGRLAARVQNLLHALYSAGVCLFAIQRMDINAWPEFLAAVTGHVYSLADLEHIGARIAALRQAFNLREGLRVTEFRLPGRAVGNPPLPGGPLAGIRLDMDTMVKDYYQAQGWDSATGRPKPERLRELGLEDVAAALG